LDFAKFNFWPQSRLWGAETKPRFKFGGNRTNGLGDIAFLVFFKMAAGGHLGFQKFHFYEIFALGIPSGWFLRNLVHFGQTVSILLPYLYISIGARRPSWILQNGIFDLKVVSEVPRRSSGSNLVEIGRTASEILRF
jgi:hypothetical protein